VRSGDTRGLPAAVELSAYRVVQEALTNALKYAPGAPVRIVQQTGAQNLEVEVCNDATPTGGQGSGSGSGHGLAGLRERVAVFGGTFAAGPLPQGGWRVRACFPTAR
jgi:signal transduction histidine kinase